MRKNCFSTVPTYLLTYLRSWALLEEPPIVQPLENFPAFCGTRRFNTAFTRALHWSLSWAISIQSTSSHPISLTKSHVHFLSLRSSIQGIRPGPRLLVYFRNRLIFYGEELLAPRPTRRTTACRLSATAYSIYSQLPFISGGRLLHPQPEDALCHGEKDPSNMDNGPILTKY
jgi:hypothetical protein